MILDSSCEPYRDKIELSIRNFSPLAPGIEDIPCTIGVVAENCKDARLGELNGCLIEPKSGDLPFTILIAERQFKDSQYIHTLIHELMHLLDYYQFIKENGNINTKSPEEKERLHCWEFYLWAEFHAKQVGLWFFSIYTWYEQGLEPPPDSRYSFAIDWQTKSIDESLDRFLAGRASTSANNYLWDLILALVNYYARMSLDEAIGPDSIPDPAFPRDKLISALGESAMELFPLLRRMRFYGEAIPLLPSLNALIDKIIAKLNAESPWSVLKAIQFEQMSAVQDQIHKIVESITQSISMTDAFKSLSQSLPMNDAIRSWADSIPSPGKRIGGSRKEEDGKPNG